MKYKRTVLLDLDGVLNQYNGKFEADFIPPPLNGAKEFLEKLSQRFDVKLFTTRNRLLAAKWLIEHRLDIYISDITNVKEPAWLHIDDRCLKFNGNFDETFTNIQTFDVWYKS
ncbi:hypothetical protein IJ579_09320 [bacterium]|nr:hypothetical protein [bacterium]